MKAVNDASRTLLSEDLKIKIMTAAVLLWVEGIFQ